MVNVMKERKKRNFKLKLSTITCIKSKIIKNQFYLCLLNIT